MCLNSSRLRRGPDRSLWSTIRGVSLGLGFVLAAACASSTTFIETWRNPQFEPVGLDGRTVLALVITSDEAMRRSGEDALAAAITAKGGNGVPAWTQLSTTDARDEAKARSALAAAGVAAVVTMEMVDESQSTSTPAVRVGWRWTDHGSFWPHYRHAWGVAWSSSPPPRTNVLVETSIHTLDPDELVWAGRSKSRNVAAPDLFGEIAAEAAVEVQRAGLIKASGR